MSDKSQVETAPVSVILPVRNGERYISAAVRSVIGQTPTPAEVIIINDGSTDGTARAAGALAPRVEFVQAVGSGLGAALNQGLERARHEFVGFVDADDLWAAGKLRAQLDVLAGDPDIDLCFGMQRQFISPDLSEAEAAELRPPGVPAHVPSKGTMLMRRRAFERHGGFDEGLRVGDFIAWYSRALAMGARHERLMRVVLLRRLHASNTTRRSRDAYVDYARAARIALAARRGASGG